MRYIPTKLLKDIRTDPAYSLCARYGWHGHACDGRITYDHAVTFGGKQLQEKWAIVNLCAKSHNVDQFQDVGDYNREISLWIALNRGTEAQLGSISKVTNYLREKARLNAKYGVWHQKVPEVADMIAKMNKTPVRPGLTHYVVSQDEMEKIEKCIRFHKEIMGAFQSPHMMLRIMIEDYYDTVGQALQKTDPENYKALGFDTK